jgi:hypothetical protein
VKVYVVAVAEYIVQPVVDGVPANIGLCVATAVPLELTTIDWQAVGKLVGKVIVFDPDTSVPVPNCVMIPEGIFW